MSLDKATVREIARLARIDVPDQGLDAMVGDLNGILAWVEALNELDTTAVEPLANVTGHDLLARADTVTDGDDAARVLANAPDPIDSFFAVPKVVE
jgi:aspartyl-tRNA(Asn)/glutamyl-tRNA(Gln) amidotransferase subunit C